MERSWANYNYFDFFANYDAYHIWRHLLVVMKAVLKIKDWLHSKDAQFKVICFDNITNKILAVQRLNDSNKFTTIKSVIANCSSGRRITNTEYVVSILVFSPDLIHIDYGVFYDAIAPNRRTEANAILLKTCAINNFEKSVTEL